MDEILAAFHRSNDPPEHLKRELSYPQMLRMADLYDGWAQGARRTPADTGMLMGWADGLRVLADQVGEDWSPPPVVRKKLGPIGFIARMLDEGDPGRSRRTKTTKASPPRKRLTPAQRQRLIEKLERGLTDDRVSPETKALARKAMRLMRKGPRT